MSLYKIILRIKNNNICYNKNYTEILIKIFFIMFLLLLIFRYKYISTIEVLGDYVSIIIC